MFTCNLDQQLPQQDKKPFAHFLIGIPGSGKSTFAKIISQVSQPGECEIISTDSIRKELYGDEAIQGNWSEIESEAINRIYTAFKAGKSVVYDATNFKRALRMDFLHKLKIAAELQQSVELGWIAWHINTPIDTCLVRNQQRERKVPSQVINDMYVALQNFPPVGAEGFLAVNIVDVNSPKCSKNQIIDLITKTPRRIINTNNRTKNQKIIFHKYSNLIDFDRLLHLISLLIEFPGLGNLQHTNPALLTAIFNESHNFTTSIQEISAIMAKTRGKIYADENKICEDLKWLQEQGIIADYGENIHYQTADQHIESLPLDTTHSYSDKKTFDRLIGTIRLIIQNPLLGDMSKSCLVTLAQALKLAGVIQDHKNEQGTLRRDIERVLKPYKILPNFPMRQGYFAGTGILSKTEMIKVYDVLQSQAKSLNDPSALEIYETFKQRLLYSKLIKNNDIIYPVRAIANSPKINLKYIPSEALTHNIPLIESAIEGGKLLEVNRFVNVAGYPKDKKTSMLIYPLQIVFQLSLGIWGLSVLEVKNMVCCDLNDLTGYF